MSAKPSLLTQHQLIDANGVIPYTIRLSPRRRRVTVQVHPDGRVLVAAPMGTPLAELRGFVDERRDWIVKHWTRFRRLAVPVRALQDRATVPLLDDRLRLRVTLGAMRESAMRHGDELALAARDEGRARELLERWYRARAHEIAHERVRRYSSSIGRQPARIVIRGQKTRWGSCSPRGTISLNWRLLLAPSAVFDYVLVHELCHLLHPNHSPRFWSAVARVMPDYTEQRRRLHLIGHSLSF